MSDYPAVATIIYRDGERSVERFADEASLVAAIAEWFTADDPDFDTPTDTINVLRGDYGDAGTHQGDFVARDVTGTISGSDVRLRSNYGQGGDSLSFTFAGKVSGDGMSGELDMGEYLTAKWTARRG